jgi:hypothetical protein
VRRFPLFLATAVVIVAGLSFSIDSPPAAAVSAASCSTSAIRITDDNTVVGAGSVNDLFWITNVSGQACSLRGYVRAAFVGVYGSGTSDKNPRLLSVRELHSYGRRGNDLGGLKQGLPVPTVTIQPDGGVASFWLAGTDEPVGPPPVQCIVAYKMLVWLPGSSTSIEVQPLRANGFFWCNGFAAHPILSGKSGSDPSRPLSYFFGTPS